MGLRGIGWGGMDRFDLGDDLYQRQLLLNTVMNIQVP
jgi:hypothetical protein